ncbi:hypothetical protein EOI86_12575 [Hwanghaeella grinnelliae]|uniref:Uncharacterized protein n=1 Tax=Hwanghaeella grinnelliae TaxID=2500179 RepID=A0A437QNG2_9PROT|nr:hypothetical protein [Hwanghaeella grinnelliae]RVU36062.1 hypothetical protein EOI86_12575 [Hwanghaeella grinnelliae]
MKTLIVLLLIAGLLAIAFGYWGLNTVQGRARFDEMAGMIPLFAGIAGGVATLLALILAAFRLWSARNHD